MILNVSASVSGVLVLFGPVLSSEDQGVFVSIWRVPLVRSLEARVWLALAPVWSMFSRLPLSEALAFL